MDKEDLKKAMQDAREMQKGIIEMQERLAQAVVKGLAKNKLVELIMTATGDLVDVKIKQELLKQKTTVIESSIKEAFLDAMSKVKNSLDSEFVNITGSIGT